MKTILIVDDEEDIRTIFRLKLERHYRVLEAADGTGAWALVQQEHPDLLVLDWAMPDMSGMDLLTALRRESRTADIPVIVLTGRNGHSDRARSLSLGAFAHLVKPVSPQQLEDAITAALQDRDKG